MRDIEQRIHDKSSLRKCSGETSSEMTDAIAMEMRQTVLDAAAPVRAGENIKAQMVRAFHVLQQAVPERRLMFWRVRAAWHGEAGCWSARAVRDFEERAARMRRKEEAGRAKAAELGALYSTIAERMVENDPDRHRELASQLKSAAHALGAVGRPVAAAVTP